LFLAVDRAMTSRSCASKSASLEDEEEKVKLSDEIEIDFTFLLNSFDFLMLDQYNRVVRHEISMVHE